MCEINGGVWRKTAFSVSFYYHEPITCELVTWYFNQTIFKIFFMIFYYSSPDLYGSRIQPLRPIADKPNHVDPRTHGDMPGGYYNKDVQVMRYSLTYFLIRSWCFYSILLIGRHIDLSKFMVVPRDITLGWSL